MPVTSFSSRYFPRQICFSIKSLHKECITDHTSCQEWWIPDHQRYAHHVNTVLRPKQDCSEMCENLLFALWGKCFFFQRFRCYYFVLSNAQLLSVVRKNFLVLKATLHGVYYPSLTLTSAGTLWGHSRQNLMKTSPPPFSIQSIQY